MRRVMVVLSEHMQAACSRRVSVLGHFQAGLFAVLCVGPSILIRFSSLSDFITGMLQTQVLRFHQHAKVLLGGTGRTTHSVHGSIT